MFEPSANELIKITNESILNDTEKVKSRFTIVMAAAKRARELVDHQDFRVVGEGAYNPLTVAVEEFRDKKVKIVKENQD